MPPSEHELRLRERLSRLRNMPLLGGTKLSGELDRLQRQLDRIEQEPTDEEIWRSVELARHDERPYTLDYVERLLDDWFELHGDRGRADDGAMVAGLGKLDGRTVALIGQQKGRDAQERVDAPVRDAVSRGLRKAMRVMELAERHGFPVISLVDTPGAYPGVAAEQHGQGGAIAASQAVDGAADRADRRLRDRRGRLGRRDRDRARRPRADAGERDLLGDLARGLRADPLARRASEAKKAAAAFKPDARHCLELGVIDGIVPEPRGRRPERPRRRPRGCSAKRSARRSTSSTDVPATSCGAPPASEVPLAWASSPEPACSRRSPQRPQSFQRPQSRRIAGAYSPASGADRPTVSHADGL